MAKSSGTPKSKPPSNAASELTLGQLAPDFDLPIAGGGRIRRADLAGSPAVIYFYPKDDTPGCTTQAINFTEKAAEFAALGARVLGISRDTVKKHESFIAKHDLKVILASDAEGQMTEAYGVWVEKSLYGRTYMGVERCTLLIDPKGFVCKVWRKVKVPGHVAEVLATVRNLPR